MKNRNITQLNLSNSELKDLCSHYWKILSTIAKIDKVSHPKEIDFILSLITGTNLEWCNDRLKQINHHEENRKIDIKWYYINNDYIRVFELENIIFYELEKNIQTFVKDIEKKESYDVLIKKVAESVDRIKEILYSKKEIIWDIYINGFFNSLYVYCEKIALLVGKWLFGKKILPEEQKMLDLLKEKMQIKWVITQEYIDIHRWTGSNTKLLFD